MDPNLVIMELQGVTRISKETFTAVGSDPVVEIFLGAYLRVEWEFWCLWLAGSRTRV